MATIKIDVPIYCTCGEELSEGRDENTLEPCERCKDESYDEGQGDGYAQCEKDNNL